MKKFYITFGQKYRHDKHPMVDYADPDGYVVIYAKSSLLARKKAFETFGKYWSNLYAEEDMDKSFFPKGILKILQITNALI